jgi:nitrous oxide reductase accessory protein NosL
MNRRRFIHGLALTPLATALLAACGEDTRGWPEGMRPIHWDRDACGRCKMIISDRRFAAQVRGGPKDESFSFDDIGCAMSWCDDKHKLFPWLNDPATRFWVADAANPGTRWLDARQAHYVAGPRSPMGYDLAAQAMPGPGSLAYAAAAQQVVQAFPANCLPSEAQAPTQAGVRTAEVAR